MARILQNGIEYNGWGSEGVDYAITFTTTGSTSVTLSDSDITTSSTIDVYTASEIDYF